MIECRNIVKKYVSVTALNDASITLAPGKIYAILGPNGSGKTTLMKIIAGLSRPTSGEVLYDANPMTYEDKADVAYMPTESFCYSYMSAENLGQYYDDFFDDFSFEKYISMLHEMEIQPNAKLSKLSSGMMAKVKIAVTLARNSKLIMLDEPLNGIDIIAREKIIKCIISEASDNKTILLSSHLIDELEKLIDNAVFIKNGRILLEGEVEKLREERGKSVVEIYKELFA